MEFKKLRKPISIKEVEPIEEILKRFGSGSMSHGALSAEAHETLAVGMNRLKEPLVAEKVVRMLKDLKLYLTGTVQIKSKTNRICKIWSNR